MAFTSRHHADRLDGEGRSLLNRSGVFFIDDVDERSSRDRNQIKERWPNQPAAYLRAALVSRACAGSGGGATQVEAGAGVDAGVAAGVADAAMGTTEKSSKFALHSCFE